MFSKLKIPLTFFPILVAMLLVTASSTVTVWNNLAHPTVLAKSERLVPRDKKISNNPPPAQTISGIQSVARRKAVVDVSTLQTETLTNSAASSVAEQKRTVERRSLGPKPYDLPVPTNVVATQLRPPTGLSSKLSISDLTSPSPSESFSGPVDNDFVIPPDPHGAVGPNHLLTVLNSVLTIKNFQTSNETTIRLIDFWRGVGSLDDAGDPRALYDAFQQRWILTAAANEGSQDPGLLIGVSQTTDPTGKWNIYRIDADPNQQLLADFPSTGFNKNWIVIQANMFSLTSFDFVKSNLYVFDKADLYTGGTGKHSVMSLDGLGPNQAPAITYDNQTDTMYLLQNWNGNQSGQGVLRIYTITGNVGSEVLTAGNFVAVNQTWDSHPPNFVDFAPQLDLQFKIQTNDAAFASVFVRNGSIWAAHTVFLPAGGSPTHSAIQWWQLSPDGTIKQTNRIEDPTGQMLYAFPSLAVNKLEDVLLGYSRFSATQYAGANYSFRRASDPPNTFRPDTVLKDGEGPYFKTYGGDQNRWGDYSATMVDPSNDVDLWTIQEAAYTPSRWRTWWGHFSPIVPNPSSDFAVSIQSSVSQTAAGGHITYTVKPVNLGPDTAPDTSIAFTIPANATFGSVNDGGWNCVTPAIGAKETVTCSTGAFPKLRKTVISITVSVDSSATGTISASATISSSAADPNAANNTSATSIPVGSNITLDLNQTSNITIAAGAQFVVSLRVGSNGGFLAGIPVSFGLTFTPDSGPSAISGSATQAKTPIGITGISSIENNALALAVRSQSKSIPNANRVVPASGPSLSSTLVFTNISGAALSTLSAGSITGTATVTISVPGATSAVIIFKIVAGIDLQVTTRHIGNFKAGVRSEVLVTITNVGPLPYFGSYQIDDSFHEGFQEDIQHLDGNCSGGANHVQCFLDGLGQPGKSQTLAFQVIPPTTGTFTNTVTLKLLSASDTNLTNNTATDSIAVESGSYDLALTETHSVFKLRRPASIDYKITNLGNTASSGLITIHHDLDGGRPIGAPDPGWTCSESSDYTCSYDGTIADGQALHLIFTVPVDSTQSDGTVPVKGTLSNVGDTNTSNNIAAENVPAIPVTTDLSVRAANLPPSALIGQTVTLAYVVENLGPEEADFVTFNDTLPSNMTLVSVTPEFGTCAFSGPIIQCNLGILPLNKQETVRVVVKLTRSGDAVQHVFLTSEVVDSDPSNSSILPKITVNNPTPIVDSLSPNQIPALSPNTVVTVTGSGFLNGAVIRWNGSDRPTIFINDTKVSAVLNAADFSQAGNGSVAVSNPQPTGAASNPVSLIITKLTARLSLSGLHYVYDGTAKSAVVDTIPAGITGIAITYSGTSATSPIDAGSYTVAASLTNSNYVAADAVGTLVIDKATQSISFPQIPDKSLYDSQFQPNAVATSGLPIGYEASGSASIAGNTITLTGAGSATITAAQTGNNNYQPAVSVSRTFNINNPLPQILRLNPGAIIAGSGQTTLRVSGSNFVPDSLVKINGVSSPATFVNRIEMDVPLSAIDVASAGTKTITISNLAPGGGNSVPVTLKIISITSSDTKNIQPGTSDTVSNAPSQSGNAGITAQLNHSQSAGGPATVSVQQYSDDPLGGSGLIDVGGGYVDLKVTGSVPGDVLNATFYYGSNVTGANEDKLQLLYFTGTKWAKVRSSGNADPIKNTSDNQDGTVSGGSFSVVFDETSSPKLSQLTGTVFSSAPGLYGDLNGDSVVNVVDLILMANFLAGNTTVDKTAGDLTLDGKINVSDLITLANFLAGNVAHLPVSISP